MSDHDEDQPTPPRDDPVTKPTDDATQGSDRPTDSGEPPAEEAQRAPDPRQIIDGARVLNVFMDNRSGGVYVSGGSLVADTLVGRDESRSGSEGERQQIRVLDYVQIAPDEVIRVRAVVARSGAIDQAGELLQRNRFVILQGRAGAGKRAAAIALLAEHISILAIDPAVTTTDLISFSAAIRRPASTAYLVHGLAPHIAKDLNEFATHRLTQQLTETGCYLVLTLDDQVRLGPDVRGSSVHIEAPDLSQILHRHLEFELAQRGGPSASVLEDLALGLEQRGVVTLCSTQGPASVHQVAHHVVAAQARGESIDDALDLIGLTAPARVRTWLAQPREPAEQLADVALLLAASVLGGCTFDTVNRHAARIEAQLARLSRLDLNKQPLEPLRRRADRLSRVMARVHVGSSVTDNGTFPAQQVTLESDALVRAVLDVIWNEHDVVVEALLQWMLEAGRDPDRNVQTRVAFAAGHLAKWDFAAVVSRLLTPWAERGAGWTAATALAAPIRTEQFAMSVRQVLRTWTSGPPALVNSVIMAWGGYVGLYLQRLAIRELLEVGLQAQHRQDVVRWIHRLMQLASAQDPRHGADVVIGLAAWLDDKRPEATSMAVDVFSRAFERAADQHAWESGLLWQVVGSAGARQASADLLAACTDKPATRARTFTALYELLSACDESGDSTGYLEIEALVVETVRRQSGSPTAQRITAFVRHWGNATPARKSLRRLRSAIEREVRR